MSPCAWLKCLIASGSSTTSFFPLSLLETQVSYAYNGSAAIYKATQSLALSAGDVVLLPAYCCGAEIGPFEQIGCELLFYDVDEYLNAEISQIEQLISQRKDIKAVLITHYFGFAQLHTLRVKQLCEDARIALLEDCAHSLFSSHNNMPLGSFGSHAIFSPRKTLPLTEGGLCVNNNSDSAKPSEPVSEQPDSLPWLQRFFYSVQQFHRSDNEHGANTLLRFVSIGVWGIPAIIVKLLKRAGLFNNAIWLTADAEGTEAALIYNVGMSYSMRKYLHNVNTSQVVKKRRDNYQCWLNEFSDSNLAMQARPLFEHLPDGCCPLYFPLIVNNPAEIVEALKLADIESFNWWQHMHSAVDWEQFPVAKQMKQSIIALPVHQHLGREQIHRMVSCIKSILS